MCAVDGWGHEDPPDEAQTQHSMAERLPVAAKQENESRRDALSQTALVDEGSNDTQRWRRWRGKDGVSLRRISPHRSKPGLDVLQRGTPNSPRRSPGRGQISPFLCRLPSTVPASAPLPRSQARNGSLVFRRSLHEQTKGRFQGPGPKSRHFL